MGSPLINCQPKMDFKFVLEQWDLDYPLLLSKSRKSKQDVVCISGDSSIQMSIQELGTIAHIVSELDFIINNGWQGMVRQWQESFMEIDFEFYEKWNA
jgi:glyoxylate carboligase